MRTNTNPSISTQEKIIELAIQMVRTRGFNAFSYRDLSEALGIKTSSIHYYFASKDDLGVAIMSAYHDDLMQTLDGFEAQGLGYLAQYKAWVNLFVGNDGAKSLLCLGGMFASDIATVSAELRDETMVFFKDIEQWLAALFENGRAAGDFCFVGSAQRLAQVVFSTLQGALSSARLFDAPERVVWAAGELEALFVKK
jgi:TetR/AcrR family transcriptional regulator, transcriptional repressor for nem operon